MSSGRAARRAARSLSAGSRWWRLNAMPASLCLARVPLVVCGCLVQTGTWTDARVRTSVCRVAACRPLLCFCSVADIVLCTVFWYAPVLTNKPYGFSRLEPCPVGAVCLTYGRPAPLGTVTCGVQRGVLKRYASYDALVRLSLSLSESSLSVSTRYLIYSGYSFNTPSVICCCKFHNI